MADEKQTVEAARTAFSEEIARFESIELNGGGLADAEAYLRELGELKIRHTGKKSALAEAKKLIGKVPPEERGEFGQFVQSVEKDIVTRLQEAETRFNEFITAAKIERERLDFLLIVGDAFARPLLDELARRPYDVASLTVLLSGGAPLSAPL